MIKSVGTGAFVHDSTCTMTGNGAAQFGHWLNVGSLMATAPMHVRHPIHDRLHVLMRLDEDRFLALLALAALELVRTNLSGVPLDGHPSDSFFARSHQ